MCDFSFGQLVSVIIPVYNTEEYVGEMINCVLRQTYSNIEIIVINDGSTDGSRQILESIKDPRIRLINVENGGVSKARNIGINACKGKKIFFWDSDDTVEPQAIEKCVVYALNNGVNSVLYSYANKIDGIKGERHNSQLKGNYYGENIVSQILPHFIGHSYEDINKWISKGGGLRDGKEHTALWRAMLDADIIKNNGLIFDPDLSLGEDTIFINQYLLFEKSIGYLDECLYYLTVRENGANLTSIKNVDLMTKNKLKLVHKREDLAVLAEKLFGADIRSYFQGTNVLSALQLCLRFSKEKKPAEGKKKLKEFISDALVSKSLKNFKPKRGIRNVPFKLIKFLPALMYFLCRLCPEKFFKKFIYV